jgi:hypothetical protein
MQLCCMDASQQQPQHEQICLQRAEQEVQGLGSSRPAPPALLIPPPPRPPPPPPLSMLSPAHVASHRAAAAD